MVHGLQVRLDHLLVLVIVEDGTWQLLLLLLHWRAHSSSILELRLVIRLNITAIV